MAIELRPVTQTKAEIERHFQAGEDCVGVYRGDFGRAGNQLVDHFYPAAYDPLPPAFAREFAEMLEDLYGGPLKDFYSLATFCESRPEARLDADGADRYAFAAETEQYLYGILLSPHHQGQHIVVQCHDKLAQRLDQQAEPDMPMEVAL